MAIRDFFPKKENSTEIKKTSTEISSPAVEDKSAYLKGLATFIRESEMAYEQRADKFAKIEGAIQIDPLKQMVDDQYLKNSILELDFIMKEIDERISNLPAYVTSGARGRIMELREKFKNLKRNIPLTNEETKRFVAEGGR